MSAATAWTLAEPGHEIVVLEGDGNFAMGIGGGALVCGSLRILRPGRIVR